MRCTGLRWNILAEARTRSRGGAGRRLNGSIDRRGRRRLLLRLLLAEAILVLAGLGLGRRLLGLLLRLLGLLQLLGPLLVLLLLELLNLLLQPLLGAKLGLLLGLLLGLSWLRLGRCLLGCRLLGCSLLGRRLLACLLLRLESCRGGRALLGEPLLTIAGLLLGLLHRTLLRGLALLSFLLGTLLGGLLGPLRGLILGALRLLLRPLLNVSQALLLGLLGTLSSFGSALGFLGALLGGFLGAPRLLGFLGARGFQRLLDFGHAPLGVILRSCARAGGSRAGACGWLRLPRRRALGIAPALAVFARRGVHYGAVSPVRGQRGRKKQHRCQK